MINNSAGFASSLACGGRERWSSDRINLEKYMKITKRHPILALVNDFVIDSPAPTN